MKEEDMKDQMALVQEKIVGKKVNSKAVFNASKELKVKDCQ